MKEENLKVIYDEMSEILREQQGSIDLLYNKLNWILVSDVVFLAALYTAHHQNFLVILLVSLSALVCLIGFQPQVFKMTANISAQLKKVEESNFLESLINKKRVAFNANDSKVSNIKRWMSLSQYLLIAAIVLQLLIIFSYYLYV